MNNEKLLDISWETIFKILFAVICLYFLYLIRNVLIWFIFAVIISVLFEPLIDFLTKRKIPRLISVVFVYFIIFGLIALSIYFTVSIFTSEIRQFTKALPQYFEKISPPFKALGLRAFENIEEFTDLLSKNLERMADTVFSAIAAIFGGILATLSIFSISLFLSLEEKPIQKALSLIFPKKYEASLLDLWSRCKIRVSGWFLSRIFGCLFVGISSFVAFSLFNTKYPFSLGILAGILNFVPIVGPIITGIIIFVIVCLDNFFQAIFVLIVFILIQQIENNILLPALTKKFIGLPPVVVLLALTVGGILWGIWGAILAIPFFGIVFEFFKEFLQKRKEKALVL
ncbi:AI-2E family transporter [Patescibacteria group bacterium]|nr:AI-2E family transporter [Patescibacteria group bacterium]